MALYLYHFLWALSVALYLAAVHPSVASKLSSCRCFPGDSCWPKPSQWQTFNQTLGGKLIATTPIAAVCHKFEDTFSHISYNSQKCDELKNTWFFPETHLDSSSSVMAPFFTNNSCNPFLPRNTSCTLGNHVSFAVNASDASDYQKTIEFTTRHNIRLIIRNTGHDYNGKSTGAGSVAIWTHHMKSIELTDYKSPWYAGKAMKMGAGVLAQDAYASADSNNVLVVGGNCPTVGLAGGYTQGGGHSPLSSKFGLAADQVLEWEVVTTTGEHLIATPMQYSDLYWALCGGGGGTFGAVVSMTTKVHPSLKVSAANLTFANTGSNSDSFWDVVTTFHQTLPAMVDAGLVVNFILTSKAFALMPATAPGVTKEELDNLWKPTLNKLKEHNIEYVYYSQMFETYLKNYHAMNTPWNVSQNQLGGRLIPRSLVKENSAGLIKALRNLVESAGVIISGVAVNVSHSVASPSAVAANPYWRESLYDAVIGTDYNYTDWETNLKLQIEMTNELLPQLEKLTPGWGAYLNEADFRQPDFKTTFYGSHYNKLDQIKAIYDPEDRLWAITAVGSDRWTQKEDGRLCKVKTASDFCEVHAFSHFSYAICSVNG